MALSLKVDVTAGSDIEDAAKDMLDLAKKLDVMIEADFNGKQVLAHEGMTKDMVICGYYAQLDRNNR